MCRSIELLFNVEPHATKAEIRAAALQFVRKISGMRKPSKANEAAFLAAVEAISATSSQLLHVLEATAAPKDRVELAEKKRSRSQRRFAEASAQ
jgi:hypothetical protein